MFLQGSILERKLEVERCILQLGASCEEITAYMQCEKKDREMYETKIMLAKFFYFR